jgi:predicted nucleic acid-binding Zn ribbon protein
LNQRSQAIRNVRLVSEVSSGPDNRGMLRLGKFLLRDTNRRDLFKLPAGRQFSLEWLECVGSYGWQLL